MKICQKKNLKDGRACANLTCTSFYTKYNKFNEPWTVLKFPFSYVNYIIHA